MKATNEKLISNKLIWISKNYNNNDKEMRIGIAESRLICTFVYLEYKCLFIISCFLLSKSPSY